MEVERQECAIDKPENECQAMIDHDVIDGVLIQNAEKPLPLHGDAGDDAVEILKGIALLAGNAGKKLVFGQPPVPPVEQMP